MAKLIVDGKEYEMLQFSTLTIGEHRVMKKYTGVAGQALDSLAFDDPDLIAAIIHISFAREDPSQSFAAIEKRVDAVKYSQLDLETDEEGEADPPTREVPAQQASSVENGRSSGTSGASISPSSAASHESTGVPI